MKWIFDISNVAKKFDRGILGLGNGLHLLEVALDVLETVKN